MTDLTPISAALGHPVQALRWHDGRLSVTLDDRRVVTFGETKREAWENMKRIVTGEWK